MSPSFGAGLVHPIFFQFSLSSARLVGLFFGVGYADAGESFSIGVTSPPQIHFVRKETMKNA